MQRILNDTDAITDDMLSGFVKAHKDLVKMGKRMADTIKELLH